MKNKEYFIKKMAEEMSLPVELINTVIMFQGEDAGKACHIYNEIEFSGFGKFLLSQNKLKKMMGRVEKRLSEAPPDKREEMEEFLQILNKRTNEIFRIPETHP